MTHNVYIQLWQNRDRQHTFNEYLRWLHRSTRTHTKPLYTEEAIDEDSEEDVIKDVYDIATRDDAQLQRAPLRRYVVRYSNGTIKTVQPRFCTQATQLSRMSNEAAFRLHESRG